MDIQYDTAHVNQSTLLTAANTSEHLTKYQGRGYYVHGKGWAAVFWLYPWLHQEHGYGMTNTSPTCTHPLSFAHHHGGLAWEQPAQHRAHGSCRLPECLPCCTLSMCWRLVLHKVPHAVVSSPTKASTDTEKSTDPLSQIMTWELPELCMSSTSGTFSHYYNSIVAILF